MYTIFLTCKCRIELSPLRESPQLFPSTDCADHKDPVVPYRNAQIAAIVNNFTEEEIAADFLNFDETELTGREIFH